MNNTLNQHAAQPKIAGKVTEKKKKKKKYSLSLKEARLMHPLHGVIKHSTRESYRPNLLLLLHPIWR